MDIRRQVARQARLFGGDEPWDELLAEVATPPEVAASFDVMKGMVQEAELDAGDWLLDVGAYGGKHAIEFASNYGCRAIVLDLVLPGLAAAGPEIEARGLEHLVFRIQGDAHSIPLRSSSIDFVWARDMLSCVEPRQFLQECARVLKAGGVLALHAVYMTELMSREERNRFTRALALSEGCHRDIVETAISHAGFQTRRVIEVGSGSRELELVKKTSRLADDLLVTMQLRRAAWDLITRYGVDWYETILASHEWFPFMALGKLHDALYLLQVDADGN